MELTKLGYWAIAAELGSSEIATVGMGEVLGELTWR